MRQSFPTVLLAAGLAIAQTTSPAAYTTTVVTGSLSSSSIATSTITSTITPVSPVAYSVTTITSDDCTTLPDVTITESMTQTITYCSECELMTASGNTMHTTVWTTVYDDWCPDATQASGYFTPHTYTITESCSMATPTWSSAQDYVPSAFTTEVQVCTMCGEKPVTATMTFPATCSEYPAGVTGAAKPAAGGSLSAAPSASASWTSPTISSTWVNNTSGSPYAAPSTAQSGSTASTVPPAYVSPAGQSVSTSAATTASIAGWGNTTGVTPYTGSASTISAGLLVSLMSTVCIAAGAFLL